MLEIMRFVFSSFWIFCGTVILIYVTGMSVAMIVAAASGKEASFSLIRTGNGTKKEEEGEENSDT